MAKRIAHVRNLVPGLARLAVLLAMALGMPGPAFAEAESPPSLVQTPAPRGRDPAPFGGGAPRRTLSPAPCRRMRLP